MDFLAKKWPKMVIFWSKKSKSDRHLTEMQPRHFRIFSRRIFKKISLGAYGAWFQNFRGRFGARQDLEANPGSPLREVAFFQIIF